MSNDKLEKLKSKVEREFPEFTSVVDGMSVEELDARLLALAKHQEEVDEALANNQELEQLKERIKEIKEPFMSTKKALKLKMKYVHALIKEKGGQ